VQDPVFLVTPPFTQLNTPYPATAYLKGFLNTKNIDSVQADLGIETIIQLFCRKGLEDLFNHINAKNPVLSDNARRILTLKDEYLLTINHVISFLQGKSPTLAYTISKRKFLPEASRFSNTEHLEWAFGNMGMNDHSKFLCTMYLEDLSDLIQETTDEHFGFSRYAEKLGRSANSFDELYGSLKKDKTYVDEIYLELLEDHINRIHPTLVAFSVPFPGNLYAAFRCAQWLKQHHPEIKVAMGGGFPNTELRSLTDIRVFEFFDFITLDDGEAPIEKLLDHLNGKCFASELKRTFLLQENKVTYINNASCRDYKQSETGTPDYSGLPLQDYISAVEIANPMHRLWSDGRWNKLTMAHGCYWGKCTFCDISLDYIKVYEPVAASLICDRMEQLIEATGQNGFHFVDEAAPPSLMKALAIEIIKRNLVVSWWTNIRFEKNFTRDLCFLLRASGCIAVSGGLEVASDRLLGLIDKGITVAQVAKVNQHFTEAGIMVHAYLMYGFPTQTDQETIDSLEMVRQLFKTGVLQSAFWHQFTMTAHSPVGLDPEKFNVKNKSYTGSFANNDREHEDPTGADHEKYSFGLKKSLFNYMQQNCLDDSLQKWFEFKIPQTKIAKDHIEKIISEQEWLPFRPESKVIWLGKIMEAKNFTQSKKGQQREMTSISFVNKTAILSIDLPVQHADWLLTALKKLNTSGTMMSMQELKTDYENSGLEDFELFIDNKPVSNLYKVGLLRI
jgi:radical SAM superfamily enzyme YgiQ (UPF0313 family)